MRISRHNSTIFDATGAGWEAQVSKIIEGNLSDVKGTVQFYDDYCSENFFHEGYAYYPLTVVSGKKCEFFWVKWKTERTSFPFFIVKGGIVEEGNDTVPEEFVARLKNRTHYFNNRGKIKYYYHGCYGAGGKWFSNNESCIEQRAIDHIMMQIQEYLVPRIKRENWIKKYTFSISFSNSIPMCSNVDGYWYYVIGIKDGNTSYNWYVKSKEKLVAGMSSLPITVCETLPDDIYDYFIRQPWLKRQSLKNKETDTFLGVELKCPEFLGLPMKPNSVDGLIEYFETRGYAQVYQFVENARRILNYNPEIVEQHEKLRNLRDKLNATDDD